jgi:hypothetical protein
VRQQRRAKKRGACSRHTDVIGVMRESLAPDSPMLRSNNRREIAAAEEITANLLALARLWA